MIETGEPELMEPETEPVPAERDELVRVRARYCALLDLQARGLGISREAVLDHLLRRHLDPSGPST
jgi:hypothetical protein